MRILNTVALTAVLLGTSAAAIAAGGYNDVPKNDKQYKECIAYSNKTYEGGAEKSPVKGQTKAEAFCECVWNETPEDFKGSLAKFAETAAGKKVNKICEKHSNWGEG